MSDNRSHLVEVTRGAKGPVIESPVLEGQPASATFRLTSTGSTGYVQSAALPVAAIYRIYTPSIMRFAFGSTNPTLTSTSGMPLNGEYHIGLQAGDKIAVNPTSSGVVCEVTRFATT